MAASEMHIDLLTRDKDAMRIGRNVQPSEDLKGDGVRLITRGGYDWMKPSLDC